MSPPESEEDAIPLIPAERPGRSIWRLLPLVALVTLAAVLLSTAPSARSPPAAKRLLEERVLPQRINISGLNQYYVDGLYSLKGSHYEYGPDSSLGFVDGRWRLSHYHGGGTACTKITAECEGDQCLLGESVWRYVEEITWYGSTSPAPIKEKRRARVMDAATEFLAFDGEWVFKSCYTADPVIFTREVGLTSTAAASSTKSQERLSSHSAKWGFGGALNLSASGHMSLKPKWIPFKLGMPKVEASGSVTANASRSGRDSEKDVSSLLEMTKSAVMSSQCKRLEESYPLKPHQECFWQWRLPIQNVGSGEVLFVNQRALARTRNKMVVPKCAPGCADDLSKEEGSLYQVCVPGCF